MYRLIILVSSVIFLLGACKSVANDRAITAAKADITLQKRLVEVKDTAMSIEYGSTKLGGICGFAGCSWRELVSVVITSKTSNAPTETLLFVVEGMEPDRGAKPTVKKVELQFE